MSLLENDTGVGFGLKGQSKKRVGVVGSSDAGQGVIGQNGIAADTDPALSQLQCGVLGISKDGPGVSGASDKSAGIIGVSIRNRAVDATSVQAEAVVGTSLEQDAIVGRALGAGKTGVLGVGGPSGDGVTGISVAGNGVFGYSLAVGDGTSTGVLGVAKGRGLGVSGYSPRGPVGTLGMSDEGFGVFGQSNGTGSGVEGHSARGSGVVGQSDSNANGVEGRSARGKGVLGVSNNPVGGIGVHGIGTGIGVSGENTGSLGGPGVQGTSVKGYGVIGQGVVGGVAGDGNYAGVIGTSRFMGVVGKAIPHPLGGGVCGSSTSTGTAVRGDAENGRAVWGLSVNGAGVEGWSNHPKNVGGAAWAGYFRGAVNVTGPVYKSGGGFRIDHPSDPANRYLSHSFVESPDMKNVYDGVVTLGIRGDAVVGLPAWFEALNRDFRYQLTAIGGAAPELHVAEEMRRCRFRIAGGTKGLRVCWQVTGIRRDAWAEQNRIPTEESKPRSERGTYRHPEAFGKSDDLSVEWARDPALLRALKRERKPKEALIDTLRRLTKERLASATAGSKPVTPVAKKRRSPKRDAK